MMSTVWTNAFEPRSTFGWSLQPVLSAAWTK